MKISIFAKNIAALRKRDKIMQVKIAELMGIKATTWSNYENGVSEPTIATIIKISRFFGVKIDDLLTVDLGNSKDFGKGHANLNVTAAKEKSNDTRADESDTAKEWASIILLKGIDEKIDRLLELRGNKPKTRTT